MPSKIELIEKDGLYFIRKQGRFFTFWWFNDAWESGWRMFRPCALKKGDAEAAFDRMKQEIIDDARFAAAPETVIKTLIT